jgi:hypothetical protein
LQEDFAEFYYVWKRSEMAEPWRKSRMHIKEKKMRDRLNEELLLNLSKERILTRKATAAVRDSLRNSEEIDGSIPSTSSTASEKKGRTSSASESTDSLKEHVEKPQNELPEVTTSEKSVKKNGQISAKSTKCPKPKKVTKSCRKPSMKTKAKKKQEESLNNEILLNLSKDRMLTPSAVVAARHSLRNSEETDDSMPSTSSTASEKGRTSSAAESTDSSKEHVEEPQTATSGTTMKENGQISDNSTECPKRGRKRKLSNPCKIVYIDSEEESQESELIEEAVRVSIPSIWKNKKKRRC